MLYGTFGSFELPHNPTVSSTRLSYAEPEPVLTHTSALVAARHNWSILSEALRYLRPSRTFLAQAAPLPPVARCTQTLQAIWLNTAFPGLGSSKGIMWTHSAARLLGHEKVVRYFARLKTLNRDRFPVWAWPSDTVIEPADAKFLVWLWNALGYPLPSAKQPAATHLRWYVFTNSLSGTTAKQKLAQLKQFPQAFRRMLVLVADDISVNDTLKLCELLGARASYDVAVARDRDGERVLRGSALYARVCATWGDSTNPKRNPVLFASVSNRAQRERLLKHYSAPRKTEVTATVYETTDREGKSSVKAKTKTHTVRTTVGAASLVFA